MTTIDIPWVYAAQRDTWLLAEVLDGVLDEVLDEGPRTTTRRRVLEVGTGSGALAVRAADRSGTAVTAVDVCPQALDAAGTAARSRGLDVRLLLGDLTAPVAGERFDVVISNPPYVPSPDATVPTAGPARAWDAGPDGRLVLDRLCRDVPGILSPGGTVLIVQSALAGVDATVESLQAEGLDVDVAARCTHPFGPVLLGRVGYLEGIGLIEPGCRDEELVVVRGRA